MTRVGIQRTFLWARILDLCHGLTRTKPPAYRVRKVTSQTNASCPPSLVYIVHTGHNFRSVWWHHYHTVQSQIDCGQQNTCATSIATSLIWAWRCFYHDGQTCRYQREALYSFFLHAMRNGSDLLMALDRTTRQSAHDHTCVHKVPNSNIRCRVL